MSMGVAAAEFIAGPPYNRRIACVVCGADLGGQPAQAFHVPVLTWGVLSIIACLHHDKFETVKAAEPTLRGIRFEDDTEFAES